MWRLINQKNRKIFLTVGLVLVAGAILLWLGSGDDKNNISKKEKPLMEIKIPMSYQEPLVVKTLDYSLAIAPIDARSVPAEMLGENLIKYIDAYEATDIEQIKYSNKLKESIILKAAGHPDKFVYQIDTENYNWDKDGDGNIIVSSKTAKPKAIPTSDGAVLSEGVMKKYIKATSQVFKIPRPFMVDNNGIKGEVKAEVEGNKLILIPDGQWIKTHNYPIVVDPTIEKLPQIKEEMADKRTAGSLTFLNDDDSLTTMAHVAQVNYQDRQTGALKPIDTNLIDRGDDWQEEGAPYKLSLPKFADQWIQFTDLYEGKNQTLEMRAMADHVSGRLITDEQDLWHGKKVVYPDAFGRGYDLELVSGNIAFMKWIKITEQPADLSRDLEFEFELKLPQGSNLETKDGKWNGQDAKKTKEQIKLDDTKGGLTYLRDFTAWDSHGLTIDIEVEISEKGNKIILKKIIPREFLEKAVYPVYTDASVSYYAGAGDGVVSKSDSPNWNTTHDATTGSGASHTNNYSYVGIDVDLPEAYKLFRAFFPVDTSALNDSAVISGATFYVYINGMSDSDNDGHDYLAIVGETTQADTASLSTADFDTCGSVDSPTKGSADLDLGNVTNNAYNSFALNATGVSWVSKNGFTKIGMREGHDIDDSQPDGDQTYATLYNSEQSGTGTDPYLAITYNVNPSATTVTDTPDPTNPGRSVSFIYDWNDDAGDTVKIKICKTNSLTGQNCDGGYWASSTDFTTNDPAVVTYNVAAEDAGQTRDYWAFACDNGGMCTTGTAGTFSVNSQSTVPNIKVRGGLRVR